jgi:hypothetical protein
VSEVGLDCLSYWIEDCSVFLYRQPTKMEHMAANIEKMDGKMPLKKRRFSTKKGWMPR